AARKLRQRYLACVPPGLVALLPHLAGHPCDTSARAGGAAPGRRACIAPWCLRDSGSVETQCAGTRADCRHAALVRLVLVAGLSTDVAALTWDQSPTRCTSYRRSASAIPPS